MITASEFINLFILALLPAERWQAARQLKHGFMTERWFITLIVMVLVVIVILPFVVSYYKKAKQQKSAMGSFTNQAAKTEPSERKDRILKA